MQPRSNEEKRELLLSVKIELDDFDRFFWSGLEFPILKGLLRRFNQQRAATDSPSSLYVPVGRHSGFYFDLARDVHLPRDVRVVGNYTMADLALDARILGH